MPAHINHVRPTVLYHKSVTIYTNKQNVITVENLMQFMCIIHQY